MASLRPAEERDVERLIEIARRSWLSAFAQTAPFSMILRWARSDREATWYPKYWPAMLVATVDDAVVGLVQPSNDEINGLWVAPQHQRQGHGSALLRAGESVIRASGLKRAWLTCSNFNTSALAFYRSQGYAEVRRSEQILPCGAREENIVLDRFLGDQR
jgi:ribosomal protein S18 acetylase RimI-like enzyme